MCWLQCESHSCLNFSHRTFNPHFMPTYFKINVVQFIFIATIMKARRLQKSTVFLQHPVHITVKNCKKLPHENKSTTLFWFIASATQLDRYATVTACEKQPTNIFCMWINSVSTTNVFMSFVKSQSMNQEQPSKVVGLQHAQITTVLTVCLQNNTKQNRLRF